VQWVFEKPGADYGLRSSPAYPPRDLRPSTRRQLAGFIAEVLIDALIGERGFFVNPRSLDAASLRSLRQLARRAIFGHQLTDAADGGVPYNN